MFDVTAYNGACLKDEAVHINYSACNPQEFGSLPSICPPLQRSHCKPLDSLPGSSRVKISSETAAFVHGNVLVWLLVLCEWQRMQP